VTCRQLADFILDYLDGALPPEVHARFEHHLTLCPTCVRYIADYQAAVALGRDAFQDEELTADQAGVPESLVSGIMAAVRAALPSA
jgi:anti-sigma factor RsiW